ncbi:unnamed protein product [Auanema sp. JU1783]|nr:unnamed protein product [Auanema sp. JU1783]
MAENDKSDARRTYLLRVASHILGLNITEEKLKQTNALDSFCDTNKTLLVISRMQKTVELTNELRTDSSPTARVVFYKNQPTVLTSENVKTIVSIVTMNASPNEVLLKTIQNVYSQNFGNTTPRSKQLVNVVNELEESLLATVSNNNSQDKGISSLSNEIRYWKTQKGSTAQQYNESFAPLSDIMETMATRSLDDSFILVETFEDVCDSLWESQPSYGEQKMKSLIIAMSIYLCDQITLKIDESQIWKADDVPENIGIGKKDKKLKCNHRECKHLAISLCEQWDLSVRLFTGQTWKRQMEDPWKGEQLDMKYLIGFKKRLEDILSLRELTPQITALINDRGVEKEIDMILETAMKGVSALAYNPYTEDNWKSRLATTERALEPIIDRVIPILKSRLDPNKLDNTKMTADLERYRNFLSRPSIKLKLAFEREALLGRLSAMLSSKEREINDKLANIDLKSHAYLTEVASKIVWIRQQLTQISNVKTLAMTILDDLKDYDQLIKSLTSFQERMTVAEQENYDTWCRETIQSIEDSGDSIALETKGQIMMLEHKKGTLYVNYSDRLLKLLKEVRQLASLGLMIPSKIINCANQGEKFYRYGVTLKQIAHFYNTIDKQMLKCQQALMLDEAIAFEKLVISKKNEESEMGRVTWENPSQLEQFIVKLQAACNKLSEHNRRLRNKHAEIVQMVANLSAVDLFKDVDRWKEILTQIRSKIFEEELVHRASKANMNPWIIHWDRQLYKALQLQYQWGIESLHTQIQPIHTQLVFVQQELQLRPPIEEIRMKYYKEVRKFLGIPEKFKGIQESENSTRLYAPMAERNAGKMSAIFEKAEQVINKVEDVPKPFADWLILAQVDLEELIAEKFTKASDWESQLKLLKTKGREVEGLPKECRVDCIVVSTVGAKNAIEDLLQRLFETLTWTLRLSITSNLQGIQQFLSQAITTLSSRPQSIDEVAEANQKHTEFSKTNKELKALWSTLEEQHTLLRSTAGSGVDQMTSLQNDWEKFEVMLDSHQMMIKDQVQVLKQNVDQRVQALNLEVERFKAKWDQFKPKSETLQGERAAMLTAIEFIKERRVMFDELIAQKEKLEKECDQFDVPKPNFPGIDQLSADILDYENNWVIYEQFNTELDQLASEEWIVFRSKTYLFDEFLQKWLDKLKSGQQSHMGIRIVKDIDSFREFSGCLKFCRGEMLSTDHWLELFRLVHLPRGTTFEKLKFSDLISVSEHIIANVDQLKALNARAQGEVAIREAIQELEMWSAQTEFTLTDYKRSNGSQMKVIKDWKEAINSVKDSQALLQSLKSSPFYSQFTDKTSIWETRLSDLDIFLSQMNEVQRKWIHLEPIFGRGALPAEAGRFSRVDGEYRGILNDVVRDTRLVGLCSRQGLKKTLEQLVDQLARCQKALNQFLEEKRSAFPRFYFLGDDDLLEILGQSTNPTVIQSHLKKLFQGIDKVIFGSNSEVINTIVSSDGEHVELRTPVRIVPQVEIWLQQLSDEMRQTLQSLTVQAVRDSTLDPGQYPSQVLCLAESIRFCSNVEKVLETTKDLSSLRKAMQTQLEGYTSTKVANKVLELKLKSLILDLIHNIDVVDQLITLQSNDINSWTWQRQLRFYMVNEKVVMKQVNSEFDYTYEYQGNASKLVHTHLTDKCYLTLTQAMHMGLGGNPYGPAGTGKTESVKALGSLFGRQVLVFNCDEGIDVHSMGRIFIGIVECGAWGCFDEFNRLDSTVLSAVSMQIQVIQDAIKSRTSKCTLNNKTIDVNPNSAIFITLNPAGKGYGGRQKMPDNLKQLFRPVVMSVPDNEIITETILYSEGFKEAKALSKKVVTCFRLSREMLSSQQHYDWGLRALKTVLRGCGQLRSMSPDKRETDIVVQALLLNTLSKLTFADSKRFTVLIDDIFSDADKEMAKFGDLIDPLDRASKEMKIDLSDKQLQKVFQLYEQLRQRIGVVVVGPPCSGKSTIWKILHKALLILGKSSIKVLSFNPKAVSRTKLLGHMDMDSREWSDGILTMAAREVIRDTTTHTWIVCDGDIDPEWVEALNSVLDDNKLLTMPSGERIQFGSNVNFLFETNSLQHASPATVSRMGMIFISEEDLSETDVIKKWLKSSEEDDRTNLENWIEKHFQRAFSWVEKQRYAIPNMTRIAAVQNGLSQLRNSKSEAQFLERLFRGFCPLVSEDKQRIFASDIVFQGYSLPDMENPLNNYVDTKSDTIMPFLDDMGSLVIRLDDLKKDSGRPYILTASAQSSIHTLSTWLDDGNRQSFVVRGPDGCGKEELLRYCFDQDGQSQLGIIHCSAQSNALTVLQALHQHCVQTSSASGRVLKPKEKANLILFFKNFNLPAPDKYGTNEMLAFLQQILTYQGFYDDHLEWIGLENIQIVASMSPNSSSADLPARLLSLLRLYSIDYPSNNNLLSIYTAYLTPILEGPLQSAARVETVANSMVQIYEEIRSHFRISDRNHYVFSPRDLTKWTLALMRYELNDSDSVTNALAYECQRIFMDRLVSEEQKSEFLNIMSNTLSKSSSNSDIFYVTNSTVVPSSHSAGIPLVPTSKSNFEAQIKKAVNRFEFEVANFNTALTNEFCELASKVDRVLTSAGGSLLMAGRSGFGRRDVVLLIANMHQMQVFSPKISSTYSKKHFDNELKAMISTVITSGEHVVFLLEDYQILSSSFLQAVNSLLSSGDVPGLFQQTELDSLTASIRDHASQEGYHGHLHNFLFHRVRSLVHVALIMDTSSSDFDTHTAANPSIFKQCNIIWNDQFSRSALTQMPRLLFEKEKVEISEGTTESFKEILEFLPKSLVSPLKYRLFIQNYMSIYSGKKNGIKTRLDRLQAGVSKLTAAKEEVAKLQKKAAKKSKLLVEKQAEADEALSAITRSMTGAEDQKMSMEQLREATEKENEKIEAQKKIIDEQLKDVEPVIQAAREAVGSIKPESLSEIRSLRAPPEAIRDILQAVLLFMGILDTSWEAMRKFLSKSGVKDEIINFDAHRISKDVRKKVQSLVQSKQSSFDPKNAKRASVAAAPLAAWVMANLEYSAILEKISPLEQEKNALVKNLSKAEKQIEKLSKGLLTVDEKVSDLKSKFEVLMKEATQIKIDVEKEEATIAVAGTLVDRLGGEFERWQEQLKILAFEIEQVERCSLISSVLVTFLGESSERIRQEVLAKIKAFLHLENFNPVEFSSSETEQLNWKNHGLPADNLSIENAIVMFNGDQVPLIMDPTGRIAEFLHKFLEKSEMLKAVQNDFFTQVELGLRFGKTLVVDDVNSIDPCLVPILRKDLSSQGPRMVINFGDKQIDYNPDFAIFLCTKNEHISIPSGIKDLLEIVNFTTTKSGLTSQLLGTAIHIEKPELEGKSRELARDSETKKVELDKLEQLLLQELAASEGNILDNTVLLESLNRSKENAETISKSIEESEKLRSQLQQEREAYLPLAEFASSLYFAFSELHLHNKMYDFNVNTITNLFVKTIRTATDSSSTRLDSLRRALQLRVFYYISRALFKTDRLMFAFNFVVSTMSKLFQKNEMDFFIGMLMDGDREPDGSIKSLTWIDESRHAMLSKLQAQLPTLFNTLQLHDQGTWSEFSRTVECETAVPSFIDSKITPFQKVLLIQAIRPERLYSAILSFVTKSLAIPSINPPAFSLEEIHGESTAKEPILLILSSGADPSQELEELAKKVVGAEMFESISMGQGQEMIAVTALRKAMREGGWVCLNNVHLMLSIVPLIHKEIGQSESHESFRLWLTSEADERFPAILLQSSLKITFEPPPGLKNNLIRTYKQIDERKRSALTCQSIFVLAWLHALLQERRTFIPQAWSKFYEFSNADVRIARWMIEQLTEDRKPDWDFIKGLLLFVVYGGRIENVFDSFILESYLKKLFNENVITGSEGQTVANNIRILSSNKVEEYLDYIQKDVPNEDNPNLFGLPPNIRVSWELTEAEETISKLRFSASANNTKNDRSDWNEITSPVLNLWKRLCQGSDIHTKQIPNAIESGDPLVEVMSIEYAHAIQVVQSIHISLSKVSKAIRGVEAADSSTLKTIESLRLQSVPQNWENVWIGPVNPAEYLTSLIFKAKATEELLTLTKQGELLSKPVNMSKLLRPGVLLNALRQVTARKKKCTMDLLTLVCIWNQSNLSNEICITLKVSF